jgi:hypothetical protein
LKICMWEVPPKPKASAVTIAKIINSCLLIVSWRHFLKEVNCSHRAKVAHSTLRTPKLKCDFISLRSFSLLQVCNQDIGDTSATLQKKHVSCLAKACQKSASQANDCNNLSAKDNIQRTHKKTPRYPKP